VSTLKVSNLNDGTKTVATTNLTNGSAKAHIRYIQTTPAVSQSFNVSSVTDDSTGNSTVNFTNGFDATEYPCPANNSYTAGGLGVWSRMAATSTCSVITRNSSNASEDHAYNLAALGDLA